MLPLSSQGVATPATAPRYLTMAEACHLLSCHPNTLRNADKAGRLKAVRINGSVTSARRFLMKDLLDWVEVARPESREASGDEQSQTVPIALVGRVSTSKQSEDLKRQVSRLEAYATETWGM